MDNALPVYYHKFHHLKINFIVHSKSEYQRIDLSGRDRQFDDRNISQESDTSKSSCNQKVFKKKHM